MPVLVFILFFFLPLASVVMAARRGVQGVNFYIKLAYVLHKAGDSGGSVFGRPLPSPLMFVESCSLLDAYTTCGRWWISENCVMCRREGEGGYCQLLGGRAGFSF